MIARRDWLLSQDSHERADFAASNCLAFSRAKNSGLVVSLHTKSFQFDTVRPPIPLKGR